MGCSCWEPVAIVVAETRTPAASRRIGRCPSNEYVIDHDQVSRLFLLGRIVRRTWQEDDMNLGGWGTPTTAKRRQSGFSDDTPRFA